MALSRVYRNLNTGLWSVQQKIGGKWTVVAHAAAVTLCNVTVKQSIAGRDRARRENTRNVHCMAEGSLAYIGQFHNFKGRPVETAPAVVSGCVRGITYNPFKHDTLVYRDSEAPYSGSAAAVFSDDQKMYVN